MSLQKYVPWAAGAIALVALFVTLNQPAAVTKIVKETLGSASSPSVVGGCMDVNGVVSCSYRSAMAKQASTTCMFRSPAATSSLRMASALFVTSTSSMQVEWGTSANIQATTTRLGYGTTSAGGQGTILASSSPATFSAVDDLTVIPPSNYVSLKIGSGNVGIPTGACETVFTIL